MSRQTGEIEIRHILEVEDFGDMATSEVLAIAAVRKGQGVGKVGVEVCEGL
ncbi:hypothetical protein ATK36_2363 [Amycolatopsis sulphurea]|uniref:Uncharacterized protein n=1 Tax=Amycolatopsis sulphurea TaxID=76022 RepID=A0A2A9F956_9PSEU|nr:hypothetical protein [Amycolatopsis sulphurea]PFG47326.1 hypothetical protein ATK36_2363 [Amycolatopsis sulphurea]